MVLDHSVSQSSYNSHGRTQTVEGGRCAYEQRHVGMRQSWILWYTCQPAALPPKPQKISIYSTTQFEIYMNKNGIKEEKRYIYI